MNELTPKLDLHVQRHYVLFSCVMSFAASLLFLIPDFPFDRRLCHVAFASGVMHLSIFGLFRFMTQFLWHLANFASLVIMGFALHFSGGILSPFVIFLVFILISGAGYGIRYQYAVGAAIALYACVVGLEYFGVLEPITAGPGEVYASPLTTLLIVSTVLGHLFTTGLIYKITVRNLRDRLDEEQHKKSAMLRRLSRIDSLSQVGLLLAKTTHDLKGPLGAFRGFVQMLRETEKLSSDAREDCDVMVGELDRLGKMIERLLIHIQPKQSEMAELSPKEVLESVLSVVRFYPGAKPIAFLTLLSAGADLRIRGSRAQLQQVFFNVLKNAVEALDDHPDSPTIEVILKGRGDRVVILFKDNGRGMPEHVLRTAGTASVTTKDEGSGMGLIITKEIVEGHRGSLQIRSEEQKGTTVTIRLPLSTDGLEEGKGEA